VEGESPMASIQKLIAATGAFATGLGLGARGSKASLAALTGAMEGWHAGDKERADRSVADWKNGVDSDLARWNVQSQEYKRALEAKDLDLAGRERAIKLIAAEHDNNVMIEAITTRGLEGALETFGKMQTQADTLAARRDALLISIQQKDLDREARAELEKSRQEVMRQIAEMQDATRRDIAAGRREDAAAARQLKADTLAQGRILPPKETNWFAQSTGFVEQLRDIRDAYKPDYTGPVKEWTKWAVSKAKGLPDDEESFRATLANFANVLTQLRSGAVVTNQEFERIRRELPGTNDPPVKFRSKLDTAIRLTEEAIARERDYFKRGGWNVPEIQYRDRSTSPRQLSRGDARYKGLRDRGMTDAEITARFPNLTLID
jgi:hypothetical protein